MYSIQRYHDISCGHRVVGHEGKCQHLHGHNYRITFTCALAPESIDVRSFADDAPRTVPGGQRPLDDVGRVIDFSAVKERLCMWLEDQWDHKFLAWSQDPLIRALCYRLEVSKESHEAQMFYQSLVVVPFNPTAENIAHHLVTEVGPAQLAGTNVRVIACTVEETRKCSAIYRIL